MVMIPRGSTPNAASGLMWGLPGGQTQLTGREGELYEELRQAESTGKTKVFTAEDAAILGIDMSGDVDDWPDWNVKFTPDNSDTGFAVSALSPDGFEYTQTGGIITPQGAKYASSDAYKKAMQQSGGTTYTVTGNTAGYVQLDSGEWISEFDYYSYQPEYRAKLKSAGVAGFNEYMGTTIQAKATQMNIDAGYMQIATGDWVDKAWYNTLTPQLQSILNNYGWDAFPQKVNDLNAAMQWANSNGPAGWQTAGLGAAAAMGGEGASQLAELKAVTGSELEAWSQLGDYLYTGLSPVDVHETMKGIALPPGVSELQGYQQIQAFEEAARLDRFDAVLAAFSSFQPSLAGLSLDERRPYVQRTLDYYQNLIDTDPDAFLQEMARIAHINDTAIESNISMDFYEAVVDYFYPSLSDEDKDWIFGRVPEEGYTTQIPLYDEAGNVTGAQPAIIVPEKGAWGMENRVYTTAEGGGKVLIGTYNFSDSHFTPDISYLLPERGPDTRSFWQKLGGSLEAGLGDWYAQVSSAVNWLGNKTGLGEDWQDVMSAFFGGGQTQAIMEGFAPGTFEKAQARFQGARVEGMGWEAIETSVSMIPLIAIGAATAGVGAAAGGAIAGGIGLGAFGTGVATTLGATIVGGTTSRVLESVIEGGSAYDEAIAQGFSPEDADRIANEVFTKNVGELSASDYLQFAIAWGGGKLFKWMTPAALQNLANKGIVKVVMTGGKYSSIALTEAGEEYYQEIIKRQAFGEDISGAVTDIWGNLMSDEELRQVAILGAILGVGMGAAVDVVQAGTTIRQATIDNLTPELQQTFIQAKAQAIREGASIQQSTSAGLDAVAATPEGAQVVQAVTAAYDMQQKVSGMTAKTPEEAETLLSKARSTVKEVKGIVYKLATSERGQLVIPGRGELDYEQEAVIKEGMQRNLNDVHTRIYEQQEELAALEESVADDPIAQYRVRLGQRESQPLTVLVSKGEVPQTLTRKQAEALLEGSPILPSSIDAKTGRVHFHYVADRLAEKFNMTTDEFMDHIERIAETQRQILAMKEGIKMDESDALSIQKTMDLIASGVPEAEALQQEGFIYKGEKPTALQRVGTIQRVGRPQPLTFRGTKGVETEAGATPTTEQAENVPPAASGEEGAPPQPPTIPAHEEQPPGGQMPKALEGRDSVLSMSRAMIEANGTRAITRAVGRVPGVGNLVRFIKGKIDLDPGVHLAMVAQVRAQANVQHALYTGEVNTEKALVSAFGKEAVYKRMVQAEGIDYTPGAVKGMAREEFNRRMVYSGTAKGRSTNWFTPDAAMAQKYAEAHIDTSGEPEIRVYDLHDFPEGISLESTAEEGRPGHHSYYRLSEKVKPVATLSLSEASDPYEAIVTRKREGGQYTGPEENPLKGTILDICNNPQYYQLTPQQQKAISMIDGHQEYGRNYTNSQFIKDKKDQIHRYPVREGGAYLPTVDIGEDVVEYLGSDTRAITTGRGKTRVYPSAYERWQHSQKTGQPFEAETCVAVLLRGSDAYKARLAGNAVYRQAVGGKTREQVLQETHPDLYAKMQALKKRLGKLQGYRNILTKEQSEAIDIFLESDHESEDFDALEMGLGATLKPGRYVAKAQAGKDIATLNREIAKVKQDIADLRPAWTSANPKPYVLVQEGMWRYFDAKVAGDVKESLKVSNNFLIDMLDQTRRITFGLDGSPITVQGQIAALFDPIAMVRITGKQFVQTVRHRSPFYPFSQEYIKDTIAAHPKEAAEFAMLEGIPLGNTFDEFTLGWAEKMPVAGKGVRVINDALFTWLRVCKFNMWMQNSSHLAKAGYDPMVAKVSAHAVMNGVYPMADRTLEGQSAARAKMLRALPTSYSFLMEPAKLMGEAVQGYAKIATKQTLTARERLSVEMMTRMAATTVFASVLSAALSGLATGKDWDEIEQDMLDAINPDPNNGRFLSIIIGDYRVPIGGPYRALFRAIYPQEVEGVGFPVPFAGLYDFFKNRLNPFLGTQIDLIRNKDYSDRTILEGGWPSKFLQFLEYELEGTVPLSLGGVLEDLRIDRTDRIIQDLISGLMGANTINMDDTYANRIWKQMGQVDADGNVYDVGDFWGDIKPFYGDADYNRQEPYTQSVMDTMKIALEVYGNDADVPGMRYTTLIEWAREDYEAAYHQGKLEDWEYELLDGYAALTTDEERDAYCKLHPEMGTNPREDWLVSHPHENAMLALWGVEGGKLYTVEAYNDMMAMAEELGISPDAMRFGVPGIGDNLAGTPSEVMASWFEYQNKFDEFYVKGEGTPPEAQLYQLQNPEFNAWMQQHGKPEVKLTVEVLTLITDPKYKELDKAYDLLETGWERTAYLVQNPEYADTFYRLEALNKGYAPEWVDEYVTFRSDIELSGDNKWQWMADNRDFFAYAYENDPTVRQWAGESPNLEYMNLKIDYMNLNTTEKKRAFLEAHPDFTNQMFTYEAADKGCPMVAEYVAYATLKAKYGGITDPEVKLYRLQHSDFDAWLTENTNVSDVTETIEELEISVQWRARDAEYDALRTTDQRNAYLLAHTDYATAFFTREAIKKDCPLVDDWVAYSMIATQYGTSTDPEAKLYRLDHPDFDAWLTENTNTEPITDNRNALEIEMDYRAEFAEYGALLNTGQRDAYLKSHTEFALAMYSRAAWNKGYEEQWVDAYADYNWHVNVLGEKRDWYLKNHQAFFRYAQRLEGWADIDFSKVHEPGTTGSGGSEKLSYEEQAAKLGIAQKWVSAYVAYRKALDEGYSRKEYFYKHQDLYEYLLAMGIISEYEFTQGAPVTIAGVPLRVTKD